jgi:hypothetical protein
MIFGYRKIKSDLINNNSILAIDGSKGELILNPKKIF